MFSSFSRRLTAAARCNSRWNKTRLQFDRCEDRLVPAQIAWTLGAAGNFGTAANWTVVGSSPAVHQVPGASDDAIIPGSFSVTSSSTRTVNSISAANLQITGGTFTATQPITLTSGSLFVGSGATLKASMSFDGGTLAGTGSITGFVGSALTGTVSPGSLAGSTGQLTVIGGISLNGPFVVDLNGTSSAAPPAVHLVNNKGQVANAVLNTGQPFVTSFKGTDDVTISLNGQAQSDVIDHFSATPGNNPAYLSQFIGASATGTGDGTVGGLQLLQPDFLAQLPVGFPFASFQYDFSIPLTPADYLVLTDVDLDEQYLIQAYVRTGSTYVQVPVSSWVQQPFTGQTGILPDGSWAVWDPMTGTLTHGGFGNINLNQPINVLTPNQAIDRVRITCTKDSMGFTNDAAGIQFIAGTAPTQQFDQLVVNGSVTLAGNLDVGAGFTAAPSNQFKIIDNDGSDAVIGTFAGLPEGASLLAGGQPFTITYKGGTGNDVVLIRSSDPTHISFDTPGHALIGNRSRIDDQLLELYASRHPMQNPGFTLPDRQDNPYVDASNYVLIRVIASNVAAVQSGLESMGFVATGSESNLHLLEGFLPIDQIPQVESLVGIGLEAVLPVYQPKTNAGLTTSPGDWVAEADRQRNQFPNFYDGTGIRVGVLSDSYARLPMPATTAAQDIANGDLPANGITLLQEGPAYSAQTKSPGDEGRAMLQIIHDVAPGVGLAFASGFNGELNFAANIKALANPAQGNCQVIVDDLQYLEEPMFQDGVVAQAVANVVATKNVSYFSAVGNTANNSYESTGGFRFGNDRGLGATAFDFDPGAGVDTRLHINIPVNNGARLNLQWDDAFYANVLSNLDLYLFRSDTGQLVSARVRDNRAMRTPSEFMSYFNNTGQTNFDIVVNYYAADSISPPTRIKLVDYGAVQWGEWFSGASTIDPHSVAPGAVSVAAVPYYQHEMLESFNSIGPFTALFSPDGTIRYANPEVRVGPQIAAPDGVNTSFFNAGPNVENDAYPNFFGSSAAAPHAAAVAALYLQGHPGTSPAAVLARMYATSDASIGPINVSNAGLIDAYRMNYDTTIAHLPLVVDHFYTPQLLPQYDVHTTGAGRITFDSDGINEPGGLGANHLVLGSGLPGYTSASYVTLHVNANALPNPVLSFLEREYFDDNNPFFGGGYGGEHLPADGAFFSVGNLWYPIINFTSPISSNNWRPFSFNLAELAAEHGVALTADTQIRFQQTGAATNGSGHIDIAKVFVRTQGSISGVSYTDTNHNALRDNGEPGNYHRIEYIDTNNNGQFDTTMFVPYQQFNPVPIADGGIVYSYLDVPYSATPLNNLTVYLNIAEQYDGDLTVYLTSPSGQRVQLFTHVGGNGSDFMTFFGIASPDPLPPISGGQAPFPGFYQSQESLNEFLGDLQGGKWQLTVVDDVINGSVGKINSFQIQISTGERFSQTSADGTYSIPNLRYYVATNQPLCEVPTAGNVFTQPATGFYAENYNFYQNYPNRDFGSYDPVPTVNSIVHLDANPSTAALVHWRVSFSEPVNNVMANNFALVNGGAVTGTGIVNVVGAGDMWDITANTGNGDGTLGLNLVNGAGITDSGGNMLTGAPVIGQVYNIDHQAVRVQNIVINGGNVQRSRVTSLAVNFDQHITQSFSLADGFVLTRQSDGKMPALNVAVDDSGAGTIVTLTFTGNNAVESGSLADGRYTLTVLAADVYNANGLLDGDANGTDGGDYILAGNPANNSLFRLFGDADGDGSVAASDFVQLRLAFGGNSPTFDFDGDGAVAAGDFIQFRLRFGGSI